MMDGEDTHPRGRSGSTSQENRNTTRGVPTKAKTDAFSTYHFFPRGASASVVCENTNDGERGEHRQGRNHSNFCNGGEPSFLTFSTACNQYSQKELSPGVSSRR